jgi:hypothetical protein
LITINTLFAYTFFKAGSGVLRPRRLLAIRPWPWVPPTSLTFDRVGPGRGVFPFLSFQKI